MHAYYDNMRHGAGVSGLNLDMPQNLFDEWAITVNGKVGKEYTAKLPDLIKEAEAAGVVVNKPLVRHERVKEPRRCCAGFSLLS